MKNWKAPKTPSEIRSFLGLAGYYRRFIANFSKIAKPLTSLTWKNQKYEWGVDQEEAFQTLKDNLCNAPILSLPDGAEDFVVYYDASNQGLGCVLMQRGKIPLIGDVRTIIMDVGNVMRYSVHPGADKMYYDLREMYWWPGMKKDITTYVGKCLTCLKKCLADANLHVPVEEIKVDKTLCFVEEPVEIIDHEVKILKRSWVRIVKVHGNSKRGHEDFMNTKYPHLLAEQTIVGSTN
ncbi:putative reverse transcriptase domain-containing protein [Tanacetum coccineum]|uniref:Reverse transcriptase domain-containing protein n=1 Tax=Tanacetum coccineum TaxID=301880 RepID=A0ABQ5ALB7_9ASTR